jgi:hypothetical protein
MNVEIGTEAAQFLFWYYTNLNFFAVHEGRKLTTDLGDNHPVLDEDRINKVDGMLGCGGGGGGGGGA